MLVGPTFLEPSGQVMGFGLYCSGNGKLADVSSFRSLAGVFFCSLGCMKKKTIFCKSPHPDNHLIETTKPPCMPLENLDGTEAITFALFLLPFPESPLSAVPRVSVHRHLHPRRYRCRVYSVWVVCSSCVFARGMAALAVMRMMCLQGLCCQRRQADLLRHDPTYLQGLVLAFPL